jgi:hypothetical protein
MNVTLLANQPENGFKRHKGQHQSKPRLLTGGTAPRDTSLFNKDLKVRTPAKPFRQIICCQHLLEKNCISFSLSRR